MDRSKANQKEEAEINSGDSSNIQKSRHSSSSSSSSSSVVTETRRIQLNPTGEKPEVLTTTYTQNSSGTSSINTGDLSGNRGVVFHTESGGNYDSTTLGGGFRGTEESLGGSRLSEFEETYRTRVNHTVGTESRWGESGEIGHTISSSGGYGSVLTESERRYQELLQQQEEIRLRQEEEDRQRKLQEEAHLIQRQREEQERIIALQRRREEEERRKEEEGRRREEEGRRREKEERRRQEEERHRINEEQRRYEDERRREEEKRRLQEEKEHEYNYDGEKRYGVGGHHRTTESDFITGDREETIGGREFGFRMHNVSSTQELERFFGSLSKDATGYQVYSRQGQQYVQFMARFRTSADRKEYIEFQDGSMFPLQDRYGGQSYVSESTEPRDSRFLRIEGQLLIAPDSKGYIVLKDGRRFPLQGTFTYTEERTYTLRGPHDGYQSGNADNQGQKAYEQTWQEESSSHGLNPGGGYESKYDTRVHEEKRTEERTSNTRVYGRDNERFDDDFSAERPDPNLLSSRHRRESDMIDIKEFRKFEQLHRHRRDLEDDFLPDDDALQSDNIYSNSPKPQEPIRPCDAAKCVMLRCVLGPLKKDQEVWIGARYRVNAKTLKEVAFKEKVKVSTKLVARVTKQPFIGTPAKPIIKSEEITTDIEPSAPPSAPDIIPVWVVVLSACAGMIILLLLIFLLHKVSLDKNIIRMNQITYCKFVS